MLTLLQASLLSAVAYVASAIASVVPDANLIINLASLAILVAGVWMAPRALQAKNAEAQLREKDQSIQTHEQTISALRERDHVREEEVTHLRDKIADCEKRAQRAHAEAAMWSARYQEQQQYTAGPALDALKELLQHNDTESQRRHEELLEALKRLPSQS